MATRDVFSDEEQRQLRSILSRSIRLSRVRSGSLALCGTPASSAALQRGGVEHVKIGKVETPGNLRSADARVVAPGQALADPAQVRQLGDLLPYHKKPAEGLK